MAGYSFLAVFTIVIAKTADSVFMNHAYDIAIGLGEKPPVSGFVYSFGEDFFWQRIFEISDNK